MAIAFGMVMIAFAAASVLMAQGDRNSAVQRREFGGSMLISDGAVSRILLRLSQGNNSILLTRTYDPINPKTGVNYLGADSAPQSGDESSVAIDQWTGFDLSHTPCYQQIGRTAPDLALRGTLANGEPYTIRAYRYDKQKQLGTLLVEGRYQDQLSLMAVTLSIEPVLENFPGVTLISYGPESGKAVLRGRSILGLNNGNVYYSPLSSDESSLTGISAPGDTNRPQYLKALWSSSADTIKPGKLEGKLFACSLAPDIPLVPQGPDLAAITKSTTLTGSPSGIQSYQVDRIELSGSDTLTVDTTAGPVYLYINAASERGAIVLRDSAKIRNIRTDKQTPRIGDLRLFVTGTDVAYTRLYDRSCIQNAFLYAPFDDLQILASGPGCPGGRNANFEGVAWVEELYSSKNDTSNRNVKTLDSSEMNAVITPGATSGVVVPDDVSSLTDLLEYTDWPVRYRYGSIKEWRRVN